MLETYNDNMNSKIINLYISFILNLSASFSELRDNKNEINKNKQKTKKFFKKEKMKFAIT